MDERLETGTVCFGEGHRNGMLHGTLSRFSSAYHSCQFRCGLTTRLMNVRMTSVFLRIRVIPQLSVCERFSVAFCIIYVEEVFGQSKKNQCSRHCCVFTAANYHNPPLERFSQKLMDRFLCGALISRMMPQNPSKSCLIYHQRLQVAGLEKEKRRLLQSVNEKVNLLDKQDTAGYT